MHARWSGEAKYQALLAVAQAANSCRDLSSVLEVVAGTALARGWGPGDRVEFEPPLPPAVP